mgnify:CR=1 FL=1
MSSISINRSIFPMLPHGIIRGDVLPFLQPRDLILISLINKFANQCIWNPQIRENPTGENYRILLCYFISHIQKRVLNQRMQAPSSSNLMEMRTQQSVTLSKKN